MRKPSRFLRVVGAASLLASLLVGAFATSAMAQPDPDPSDEELAGDIWDGTDPSILLDEGGIFFPWVGNDDESTGLGPADTSVSVQNLTNNAAVAFAFVGAGDSAELPEPGGWDVVGPFFLAAGASKTFTAAQLGIEEGSGAPVQFSGYNALMGGADECEELIGGPLAPGVDANGNGECTDVETVVELGRIVGPAERDLQGDGFVELCVVNDANGNPAPFVGTDGEVYEWSNLDDLEELVIDEGVIPAGLNNDGDCNDEELGNAEGADLVIPAVLGGYAKQAVDGENLP